MRIFVHPTIFRCAMILFGYYARMHSTLKALNLAAAEFGSKAALAAAIKKPATTVIYWFGAPYRVPAEVCLLIEKATKGAIKQHELRPDIFKKTPTNGRT